MSQQFLADNLAALSRVNPALLAWLTATREGSSDLAADEARIVKNRLGFLDWRLPSGACLFETLSPQAVYQRWIPEESPERAATFIVGVNLGYGLHRVLTGTPDSHKVLALEPDPDMLLACLSQTDYRPFIAAGKLHFVPPDKECMERVIHQLDMHVFFGKVYLRGDTPSEQIGPAYARWIEEVRAALEAFTVELSTLRRKQDVMVGNELRNFRRASAHRSLLALQGRARGLTAVIVGAGPSLAQTGPALAQCLETCNALVVCGFQTLPALRKTGITPHLSLGLDFNRTLESVYDHLDSAWAANIPLIYSTKMDACVVERYPGPALGLWTVGGLSTYIGQDRELVIDAGGNVGVAMFRFLACCGVSDFILLGQDFGWRGDSVHAPGHFKHGRQVSFNPNQHVLLKDPDGGEVYSSVQYAASKRELEASIAQSGARVRNVWGGGAAIEGAPRISLDEAVACLANLDAQPRSAFQAVLAECMQPGPRPVFEARSPSWTASLRNVEKRLARLFDTPAASRQDIHQTLLQVETFLKQDPLYLPYLFNEVVDLGGLLRTRSTYALADLGEVRRIFKRVLSKVREMDRFLAANRVT